MIRIDESKKGEIFGLLPNECYNLRDLFKYITSEDFTDLHKICNRKKEEISNIELEYITKLTIGIIMLELDIEEFPEESLQKFVNKFSTSVILEGLVRKGIVQYIGTPNLITEYTIELTDKGKVLGKELKQNKFD